MKKNILKIGMAVLAGGIVYKILDDLDIANQKIASHDQDLADVMDMCDLLHSNQGNIFKMINNIKKRLFFFI